MVSLRMRLVMRTLRKNKARPREISVAAYRQGLENVLESLPNVATGVSFKSEQIEHVPAEWIKNPDAEDDAVVLYFHGGGFIAGSVDISRFFAAQFAQRIKTPFLLFEYGLAPEKPFPEAINDAISVYQWLVDVKGIAPNRIAFFGESAGGGLVFATLVKLRERGLELPATAVCLSPWLDLTLTGESMITKAEKDPILSLEEMEFLVQQYVGNNNPENPLISPLYADLKGLPPIFIQVGTSEMILDDSLRIAKKAEEAGVDVTLDVWEDMPHVFSLFFQFTPESRDAIDRVCEYLSKFLP